jgi:hypothetical protein
MKALLMPIDADVLGRDIRRFASGQGSRGAPASGSTGYDRGP